ncbi:MAG: hypothetical protein KC636_24035 [Myxococcales bacterium]|nr:hypothetical protein [Myxococcales bacterium]
MTWRWIAASTGLCFGLGLGLAGSERSAHACECELPRVEATLVSVDGDGDLAAEQAFWGAQMTIEDSGVDVRTTFDDGRSGPDLQGAP